MVADLPANAPVALTVDRSSDVPLAIQLAWKLRTLIATGRLGPDDRLPGVREVAESAGVNVNTVRGVYGRLEEEGLVVSQHGRGTFVAPGARSQAELAAIAAETAARARAAGVDLRDVAAALYVDGAATGRRDPEPPAAAARARAPEPAKATGEPERPAELDERPRRRELRAEIARLERELAYVEGLTGEPLATPNVAAGAIPRTAELEAIRDRLLERLAARRADLEEVRREIMAARYAPDPPSDSQPAGRRAWRRGGASTGRAGTPGVVWTRGS